MPNNRKNLTKCHFWNKIDIKKHNFYVLVVFGNIYKNGKIISYLGLLRIGGLDYLINALF